MSVGRKGRGGKPGEVPGGVKELASASIDEKK